MFLYLIRHAQSQNNAVPESQRVEDPGITEIGRRQAMCLAERVASLELTRLVTSPFRRTLETTKLIGEATSLVPEVRLELHELGGCYRGYTPQNIVGRPGMNRLAIEKEFSALVVSPEIDRNGWWASKPQETRELARRRAAKLLRGTVDEFGDTDERVAFVMHADIKILLLEQFHPEPLDVPRNTSLTTLQISSKECRLEHYNCVRHLPSELITH